MPYGYVDVHITPSVCAQTLLWAKEERMSGKKGKFGEFLSGKGSNDAPNPEITPTSPENLDFLRLVLSSPGADEELVGKVVKSGNEGYVFVGEVTDGEGNTIFTGQGDVFLHEDDFRGGKLEVGTVIKFKMVPDPTRDNCYRAMEAHTPDVSLVRSAPKTIFPVSVRTGKPSLWHIKGKKIDLEEIIKAAANKPFKGLVRPANEAEAIAMANHLNLAEAAMRYLYILFPTMDDQDYDVSWDVINMDEGHDREEAERMSGHVESLRSDNMEEAAEDLKSEYQDFCDVRATFRYLHSQQLILPQSILDVKKYLPTIFAAAPVWFVRTPEDIKYPSNDEDDPRVSHFVEHICHIIGTEQFGHMFQMFNRRDRGFHQYKGDQIKPYIYKLIQQIMKDSADHSLFDYLVIATPYHNVASQEWANPSWQALNDPYLLGFKKNLPEVFFVLGRWSDTGIFPAVHEMIADTIAFLRENKGKLSNFNNPYWWTPDSPSGSLPSGCGREVLIPFADELIRHFENGTLFPFLRGEDC